LSEQSLSLVEIEVRLVGQKRTHVSFSGHQAVPRRQVLLVSRKTVDQKRFALALKIGAENRGTMLGSQYSTICGEKKCVFLKNRCYQNFAQSIFVFSQKRQFTPPIFFYKNILKIITSTPDQGPML
jgi:hypothetical protein